MTKKTMTTTDMHSGSRRLALVLVAVGIAISGCGRKEDVVAENVIRPVKMMALERGGLGETIELPGQIEAAKRANMSFEVSGLMVEMLVKEGHAVSEGDLLARIDSADFKANRDAASAQLEAAKLEATRAQGLYDRQATSKQRLDLSLSNLAVARANFDKADKAFNDTSMRAPIAGTVAKIYVEDIVNVRAKQDILVIHDTSKLKVVVDVPETLGILAKPGISLEERAKRAKPTVFLTSLSERGFPARIEEVSSLADPATRTYEVTLSFDPPSDLNILPGMTAKLSVSLADDIIGNTDAYSVPSQAVAGGEDGSSYVWAVDAASMTVSRKAVTTGKLSGSKIEVFSDELSDGDWIAVSGVQKLQVGDQVSKYEN